MAEFQLDPRKTARVLIDLQNAIVAMSTALHPAAQVVDNSGKLAEAFRRHGSPVVYARVDFNDSSSFLLTSQKPWGRQDKEALKMVQIASI
jgi:nicotinamidase-related amidase